jgi:hypothetical protein
MTLSSEQLSVRREAQNHELVNRVKKLEYIQIKFPLLYLMYYKTERMYSILLYTKLPRPLQFNIELAKRNGNNEIQINESFRIEKGVPCGVVD